MSNEYIFVGATDTMNFYKEGSPLVSITLDQYMKAGDYVGAFTESEPKVIEKIVEVEKEVEKIVYRDKEYDGDGVKDGEDLFAWANRFGYAAADDYGYPGLFRKGSFERAKSIITNDFRSSKSQILLAAFAYYARTTATVETIIRDLKIDKMAVPSDETPTAYLEPKINKLSRVFKTYMNPSSDNHKQIKDFMNSRNIKKWSDYPYDFSGMIENTRTKLKA